MFIIKINQFLQLKFFLVDRFQFHFYFISTSLLLLLILQQLNVLLDFYVKLINLAQLFRRLHMALVVRKHLVIQNALGFRGQKLVVHYELDPFRLLVRNKLTFKGKVCERGCQFQNGFRLQRCCAVNYQVFTAIIACYKLLNQLCLFFVLLL